MISPFSIYDTKRRSLSVKTSMLVLTLLIGNYFWAQIGMSQWRLHVATGSAIDVVRAENTIFTAYTNGIHVLNRDNEEEELLTDVNGLSDIEISCLYYDSVEACVLVGYSNGNIDKISKDNFFEKINPTAKIFRSKIEDVAWEQPPKILSFQVRK